MRSTGKTILLWVLILLVAVGLYNFVEKGRGSSPAQLSFTAFMSKLDADEVRDVTISGSNLTGHLKATPSVEFRTVIPDNYSPIYDRLTSKSVNVRINPAVSNPWLENSLMGLPAWIILARGILWLVISAVILVLLVDLSRFVKRELTRSRGNPSTI
jgi:cell division protease FtsH